LKGCRYALWRNPEDLTPRQERKLAWIATVNTALYRAYLMKEQLRIAIRTKGVLALTMLDEWLAWAQRCRIPAFVELGRKIKRNILGIEAAMLNNLSNTLVERTNTKLRVLHRMAFGFEQPEHLNVPALLDRVATARRCRVDQRRRLRRLVDGARGLVPGGVKRPVTGRPPRTCGERPSTASRSARGLALNFAMNASTASGSSRRTPSAAAVVHSRLPKL
jgi:hypothetical protein